MLAPTRTTSENILAVYSAHLPRRIRHRSGTSFIWPKPAEISKRTNFFQQQNNKKSTATLFPVHFQQQKGRVKTYRRHEQEKNDSRYQTGLLDTPRNRQQSRSNNRVPDGKSGIQKNKWLHMLTDFIIVLRVMSDGDDNSNSTITIRYGNIRTH